LTCHIRRLLMQTVPLYLEADDKSSTKTPGALLRSLLDILQCMLKYTENIVHQTSQAQKSGTGGDTQTAEDLLLANKPLMDLSSQLIQLLRSEDTEIFVSASRCFLLLGQLYGGDSQKIMSPENMDSFAEVLKSKKDKQQLKHLLKIVIRLAVVAYVRQVCTSMDALTACIAGNEEKASQLRMPLQHVLLEMRKRHRSMMG
ncbi:PREDICTED: serine/threonine-protein kinase ULK4-like, partial [Acanthisitta chloris]|uniref:serine/threonine-protein kinase ULK4-like n=1 Tax=Acanthisitta chloris TaxID=57068 RepID=UPI0004F0CDD5